MSDINRLASSMTDAGAETGYPPANIDSLNKIGESGGLPTWAGGSWPGGGSGGGDMYKSVYDKTGDGKIDQDALPAPGTVANTYAAGNDLRFHTHTNKAALDLITAVSGVPKWNGQPWPAGGNTTVAPGSVPEFGDFSGSGLAYLAVPDNKRFMLLKSSTSPGDYVTFFVSKDTTDATGGKSTVGQNVIIQTTAGPASKTTEYNFLAKLINNSAVYTDGSGALAVGPQSVAAASHAIKNSSGPVWAHWNLIVDMEENPAASSIGCEWNLAGKNGDTNYARNVMHIACGHDVGTGGTYSQIGRAFYITNDSNSQFRRVWECSANIEESMILFNGTTATNRSTGTLYTTSSLLKSTGSTVTGIDFSTATFTSGQAITFAPTHKLAWTGGYSTWGTATNVVIGGTYDASLAGYGNDNVTLFALVRTLYQTVGYMQNELKAKGVFK